MIFMYKFKKNSKCTFTVYVDITMIERKWMSKYYNLGKRALGDQNAIHFLVLLAKYVFNQFCKSI